MAHSFGRLLAIVAAVMLAGVGRAAEPAIIAKARAYLGSDAALNAVRSIHYMGKVTTSTSSDPNKVTSATIDIIFQKPYQQKVSSSSDQVRETAALDGYDAWTRVTSATDSSKWQQTILGTEGVKRMRAQTWENLAFYRGLEKEGGHVEDLGAVTVDGVACEKIAFVHASNIVFFRYFDKATGRLADSETENGVHIREEGQIIANGVRFPQKIVQVTKQPNGQVQTVTMTFDQVKVNDTFAPELFAVPLFKRY